MENKIFGIVLSMVALCSLTSCRTLDLEKKTLAQKERDKKAKLSEQEEYLDDSKMNELIIAEEMKVQDIEPIVVYVEKPVYVPEDKDAKTDIKRLSGVDAAKESEKKSTKKPERYKDGTFYYIFNENLVYEIYCQPYHLTDIILEDGELVQGTPLLSEDDEVWELTANVAKNPSTGDNIQHLFVKPAYSKLDSSLVVITDRRVYHLRLKSFSDTHMAMVKFKYPERKTVWATKANDADGADGVGFENEYITVTNPEFLSFDYKVKYGLRKPEFMPQRVYDDGQKTYIVVDDLVLHKELPLVFNERNEIVNYSVSKNTFVIPRLINKVTLRLGRQKVVVEKKKAKGRKEKEKAEDGNKPKDEGGA